MDTKKIAVITMARNDDFFLNCWVKYYGQQFGEENLYIYLDGLDQKPPAGVGQANVKIVEKQGIKVVDAEKRRLDFLSDKAAELFSTGYELVIGCDADEFLMVDNPSGKTLAEYLSSLKINTSVSPLGLDVGQHLHNEKPFDKSKPVLAQRHYALINSRFTKTSIIAKPVRWGRGFHRINGHNFHIDPHLYLLHLGNIDYDALMDKFNSQDIIARGEQAHYKRARFRVIDSISNGKAMDGDRVFAKARKIQTVFRQIFAWNKPSMLGMRWVIQLPERFKDIEI
ncbi:MAG: glycosyltransferase family 2 protein [Dysgonamonadaceae bacterium]|nr:glycosyltransferase family 2 protein [Dysgonamonadaceae bacterium]